MGTATPQLEQFYDLRERADFGTRIPTVYISSINQNRFNTSLLRSVNVVFNGVTHHQYIGGRGVKIPQHELERFSARLGETNLLANMDSLNISGQSKRFEFGSLTI